MESKVGITAAASLAGAKRIITKVDLDASTLLSKDIVSGGVTIEGRKIIMPKGFGLGIESINYD